MTVDEYAATVASIDQRVDAVKDAITDARKAGRDALRGRYSEPGGGSMPGDVPVLPKGYAVSKPSESTKVVPPLPIGYVMTGR